MRRLWVSGGLAFLDTLDETLAVGSGERLECFEGFAAGRHRVCHIARDGQFPFVIIALDRNVNHVPNVNAQFPPNAAVDE